jgi:23S rRNA (guanine745-N1)-methyltransferase
MSLQTLSEWLRCPNCFQDLEPRDTLALACSNAHSFDVNKRRYISLIAGSKKLQSDSPAMLDARDTFLGAGWYAGLRNTLADVVAGERPGRLIDVGCGTGYYLDGVLERSPITATLAMDLSPAAVARTVRTVGAGHAGTAVDGLVADVWSPLPIRDSSADVILNVFAPRNALEFHRVLRTDGTLVVVVPHDTHLAELRAAGLMLEVQPDKAAQLIESLAERFTLASRHHVASTMSLSAADVAALVGMGPSAHHARSQVAEPADEAALWTVSAAFDILMFGKAGGLP